MNLPTGTYLQGGKYRITRFIGSGGFGCTYEAFHTELEERVAIKEFFVKDFCNRDETTSRVSVATQSKRALVEKLRSKFKDEAKAMFRLRHPGIVRVSDVFEENGTVYYVMDFIEGRSLQAIVEEEGRLPEHRALKYVRQVADALRYIHDHNRLHLDVKPGNIMVDSSDNAILIDFGASKQYDEENGENTSTLVGKTPGYAPLEQMSNKVVRFFPATDIYALGATLYKLLTGVTPPDAAMLASGGEELSPLPFTVSGNTRRAVSAAMSLKKDDRPQDIGDFLNILDGGRSGKPESGQRQSGFSGTSGAQGRPGDSTVLDEKKNDGGHGMGAGNSGNGWGGNGGDVRGRVDKGVGEGRPFSSQNPNRAKVWLIAACVIVGLVAGFFLLKNSVSKNEVVEMKFTNSKGVTFIYSGLTDSIGFPNGDGIGTYDDGTYVGKYKLGLRHGNGSFVDINNNYLYEGSFFKDLCDSGRLSLNNGSYFIGSFDTNIPINGRWYNSDSTLRSEIINGHECVDLGLSVKWATCNIGALKPSDVGDYFAWGEISSKSEFTEENSLIYGKKYYGDISGNPRYDAATANWGSRWRLPTEEEAKELLLKCEWTLITTDTLAGYKVTGQNGNSIFLPFAGRFYGSRNYDMENEDALMRYGYYWTSVQDDYTFYGIYQYAKFLDLNKNRPYFFEYYLYYGHSVRPVSD